MSKILLVSPDVLVAKNDEEAPCTDLMLIGTSVWIESEGGMCVYIFRDESGDLRVEGYNKAEDVAAFNPVFSEVLTPDD